MSKIPAAIDNSILGDLADYNLPPNKVEDFKAFEEIIKLDNKGIFEIGITLSTTMIEEQHAGKDKRKIVRERMGQAWRLWPVAVSPQKSREIDQKAECLHRIMQDKDGVDSRNLVVSTIYTSYYLTTDYRYLRQFKAQRNQIKRLCRINVHVLSPSEFLSRYKNEEL